MAKANVTTSVTSNTRAPKGETKQASDSVEAINNAAERTLDIQIIALSGKALFEAEDDGNMKELGRLLNVIGSLGDDLYSDLREIAIAEGGAV